MSDEFDKENDDKIIEILDTDELDDDTGSDVSLADDIDTNEDDDAAYNLYDEGLDENSGFSY